MPASLISLEEARSAVIEAVASPLGAEDVDLRSALGRVLAEDAVAPSDLPPFDNSAMDGFAVVSGPPAELEVIGESRAGRPATRAVGHGQAIRISTGAVVPDGADAIVPVERVEEADGGVAVPEIQAGANVRRAGEDVRAGQTVLAAGAELGPAELGVLASFGHATTRVHARPRVGLVVTGDELVGAGRRLRPGEIHDSNAVALAAQATRAGADVVSSRRVGDSHAATVEALEHAVQASELVCVAGGVSVGPHDHVKAALAELDVRERFWGIAIKPGKPTWFGSTDGTLVLGVPGNPVSAMVIFHLLGRPALRALAGADPRATRTTAVLDSPVRRSPAREQALRCRIRADGDGWHVEPAESQGSHVLTSMLRAGALAMIPSGDGQIAAGERVEVELVPGGTLSG